MESPQPTETPTSAAPPPSPNESGPAPDSVTDEKARFEAFRLALLQRTPMAFFTFALVLANVIVYAAMVAQGVSPTQPTVAAMLEWGADFPPSRCRARPGGSSLACSCISVRSIWA